ncbi:DUF262 domain-containing protein [Citrobacter freundii]|jgi:hypothetical protein|uniref:DUF262 domain-containing protein n=4 Tax=Citrobacter freundii TaxID=546 RepID=A0AAP5XVH6_CITFR|nr:MULTISPECIES: DUF262 domain-containing protein [Citrobacter]MCW0941735.1 DUF262 domain-containing protein [Citrobacter freundii]MDM3170202.1 DUF262 domain-containing protein [Citrobacter sp. Cf111]MDV2190077.1 DUF262 domain-containing protein [Citrobacter freundii]MDV2274918.1 DUF262 domain-containing protein [Citrobacter freundii]MDW2759710.1 DUF262 domain-containing protein [Citrobacter freundii]
MVSKLDNKIEARHRNLFDVLNAQKYTVDYFQREYSWGEKHIEELVTDLTSAFLNEYTVGDSRDQGENYNNYYLGPFVVSSKDGKRSIIDGQQRLTSLTLFLIYLHNLQKELEYEEKIESMIFSELRGSKSFNIVVEDRIPCMEALFNFGSYSLVDRDDESTHNMVERYQNITDAFPEELKGQAFPFFIDWLKYNVIMVEIIAYSDENAYTIFETMNDRGLNLTPSEMLKGFLLSRFHQGDKRQKANELWKKAMMDLKNYDKDEDQRFFQSWLRAQYADTIRPGKAGSKNEDFEKIGTRFHSWVRDNLQVVGLDPDNGDTFERFIQKNFLFYLNAYTQILNAERALTHQLEYVFYIHHWGIAPTLSFPLMLAPLNVGDSSEVVRAKINLVARYIETFVVRRSVNFRKFSASSIRYTMYSLVKEIRGKNFDELKELLSKKLSEMPDTFAGMEEFRLHGQNYRFVKFLLSRITAWVEQQAGMSTTFITYYQPEHGKPFEVEHIWADKYERYTDEFEQEHEFNNYRNRLGDLVLLPRGSNQSYSDLCYDQKQPHYIKENLLAKSLCPLAYMNNPNFNQLRNVLRLPFKPHNSFKKQDVDERQSLYKIICENIWDHNL